MLRVAFAMKTRNHQQLAGLNRDREKERMAKFVGPRAGPATGLDNASSQDLVYRASKQG
jgi:hypothetical protein